MTYLARRDSLQRHLASHAKPPSYRSPVVVPSVQQVLSQGSFPCLRHLEGARKAEELTPINSAPVRALTVHISNAKQRLMYHQRCSDPKAPHNLAEMKEIGLSAALLGMPVLLASIPSMSHKPSTSPAMFHIPSLMAIYKAMVGSSRKHLKPSLSHLSWPRAFIAGLSTLMLGIG